MGVRSWLARKLDPETARNAESFLRLRSDVSMAHQWLAEFRDVYAVLKWLLRRDKCYRGESGAPAFENELWDIRAFREHLRKRSPIDETRARSLSHSKEVGNVD